MKKDVDWIHLFQAGSFEHGNEPDSIKPGRFLD
jgi:hypothetical protein